MKFSHLDEQDRPRMVDVSGKALSHRVASATGFIRMKTETLELIQSRQIRKGNVLITAELAGVQAAKQTATLIPLCHTLQLSQVNVDATIETGGVKVDATVKCIGQTGVEMEALTSVSVALLTIYDMCKAVDKSMQLGNIQLLAKSKTPVHQ